MFKRLVIWIIGIGLTLPVLSQSVNVEFGKNRIQYHDDFENWNMYETANFVTYWYGKGTEIAHTVVQMAELENPGIQRILEHKMNDKIELIVYLDLSDLKQTNIGNEEQFVSRGLAKVVENKVFVYFNGNHNDLRRALREGIATVYKQSMLHGNNLQEVVQNAVLLNLPEWFNEGLVSYIGQPWTPRIGTELNDYFNNPKQKKKDFNRLARQNPRLAGHSMWYFIAQTWGRASISNILYLTRINRSLDNGLEYVLGIDSKELISQWEQFYRDKNYEKSESTIELELKLVNPKKNLFPVRLRFSPDGKKLAYVIQDNGRSRLIIYDLETETRKVVFRQGIRDNIQQTDTNYPVISWSQDGSLLNIIYEKRDVIHLAQIDPGKGVVWDDLLSPEYQRVYDMDHWSTDTLMLNATTDGFSDLYLYTPVTRQSVRLTEDFWDDIDASVAVINGQKGILFSSNRQHAQLRKMTLDTVLPLGPFNLFFFPDGEKSSLRQLTFSGEISERHARISGENELICLADIEGRWQRVRISRLEEDPPMLEWQTHYGRDIIEHEFVPGAKEIVEVFSKFDKPIIQMVPHQITGGTYVNDISSNPSTQHEVIIKKSEPEIVIDQRYLFQVPFPVPEKKPEITAETTPEPNEDFEEFTPSSNIRREYDPAAVVSFHRPRIIAARLRYKLDFVTTTVDNSLLFGGLDSYAGFSRDFEPQPLGILFKARIKDLLEDFVITGGARYPTSFNGSEYFLVFDNRKRRIDKQYALYRKSIVEPVPGQPDPLRRNQYVSFLLTSRWSYPFDIYNSIRLSATIRNDRIIALSTSRPSLEEKIDDAQRFGLRLEWVYDNSRLLDVNMRTGTRAKVFAEMVKRFDLNLFESGTKLEFNHGFMTILGIDARHYVPIDKRTVLAARFTAATSIGSERILYYLGGVENWLFASYDRGIGVPSDINFAYTSLAANMRGFRYNARNGSSVALLNTELRIPIFQYLSQQKIRSSLLRNTQLVAFMDAGTAWHGANPFSPDNPLNTIVLTNPPTVEVIVNYYRNPLIIGYGAGLRTLLFGYTVKLDYGWNWETKSSQRPILHFSLGADF